MAPAACSCVSSRVNSRVCFLPLLHSVETVAVVVPVAVDTPLTPVVAVLADTERLEAAALKDTVVDVAPSRDEM